MEKLIELLALLALRYPELKADIQRMVKRDGVSLDTWNEKLRKLEKSSASYFDQIPQPQPPQPRAFTYDAWLAADPGDAQLSNGDYVYAKTEEDGQKKWFVHQGGPLNFGMPGFPTSADMIRIVTK